MVLVTIRRYRCRTCRAVLLVGPRGLLPGRWYFAAAIGGALVRAASGQASVAVRMATSPSKTHGGSARERWITLSRWIDAVSEGRLFSISLLDGLDRRGVAERAAHVLAARAGAHEGHDLLSRCFAGAAAAA